MSGETYRFRGAEPPKVGSRASILTPVVVDGGIAELYLYDPIDSWGGDWGVSAKEFAMALAVLPDETTEIRLHINSPGGETWEMFSIVNQLARHRARVVAIVDGVAASAASVIAVAADECVMGVGAQLMIHDVWAIAVGNESDLLDMARLMSKQCNEIARMYATKAEGQVAAWRELMRAETWFTADEAVAAGLADRTVETEAKPVAQFDMSRFRYRCRADAPSPAAALEAAHVPPVSSELEEPNPKEEVTVGDALKLGLHGLLGINSPVDEVTDEQLLAAVDKALSEQVQAPVNAVPDGTVLVDKDQFDRLRADAAAGREAREEQVLARRAKLVEDAIGEGKIAPARRDHWMAALAADEEGVSAVLSSLAAGLIPVEAVGSAGAPETEEGAYSALYTAKEK